MDLSKLSDEDLDALEAGDLTRLSDMALQQLAPDRPDQTTRVERVAQGAMDPVSGAAQLATKAVPGLDETARKGVNWLRDNVLGGLLPATDQRSTDEAVRARETAYQARRGDQGGKFDAARLAGNVLSPANLGLAAAAPVGAAGLGAKMATGAGLGAASAALNPVTGEHPENFWGDKVGQLATGAVFGAVTPALGHGLGRVVSPRASTNPQVKTLMQRGVQPTIGQTLGGLPNKLEQKATALPIMGDAIASARGRAQEQFNTAAVNEALRPLGVTVKGAGSEAVDQAHQMVSNAYTQAKNQLQGVRLDQQFMQDVSQLRQLATGLTPDFAKRFEKTLNDMVIHRSPQGAMTAETFKRVDADLGQIAANFGKAPTAAGREYGAAVKQLQDLLTQQARRSNPAAAQAMAKADAAFARLVRVEDAAKRASNQEGVFTPGQFGMSVRSADRSARGNQVARGRALMQPLAQAGQTVLGNTVPDSGTAGRLMLGAGALGAGAVHPGIPSALIGGAAMYTPPMQALMRAGVTLRPQSAPALADALRRTSPLLAAPSAQLGLNMSE